MKKTFFILAIAVLVYACGSGEAEPETTTETSQTPDLSNNPVYLKGLKIISETGCATCHKVEEKIIGPSFTEIAAKYASLPDTIIDNLSKKIIDGSVGVWGEIPMPPNPNISEEDAKAMVHYIFLFKK